MVIKKASSPYDKPNSLTNNGKTNGNNKCEKWEDACAIPTSPITWASCLRGTGGDENVRGVLIPLMLTR
jgi:hypothetical protein